MEFAPDVYKRHISMIGWTPRVCRLFQFMPCDMHCVFKDFKGPYDFHDQGRDEIECVCAQN